MTKERRINIFDVLKHIDMKDYNFYDNLPEEVQKDYQPLVIMKWLAGTKDARQIVFLNELVNTGVFTAHTHKGLLHKLMCVCTTGSAKRYFWNKTKPKNGASMPKTVDVISRSYGYSSKEAVDALPLLTKEDILELANELGLQKEEITKLKAELRKK